MITDSTCCFHKRKFLSASFSAIECEREVNIVAMEEREGGGVSGGGIGCEGRIGCVCSGVGRGNGWVCSGVGR